MLYSLSTVVISDTVHALAAMESLRAAGKSSSLFAPLLDPARAGLLAIMVRNAFAETVLDLLPYVVDSSLGSETADVGPGAQAVDEDCADLLLRIELRVPPDFTSGMHGLVRRHLENAVVNRVLQTHLLSLASDSVLRGVVSPSSLAGDFGACASSALASLRRILSGPCRPFVRKPFI